VPLKGADGVVRSTAKTISLERTTPSRPIRGLRDIFLRGAATPPLPRSGVRFTHCDNFAERGSSDAIKCVYSTGLHPGLHSIAAPRPNSAAPQLLFPAFFHQR